MDRALAVPVEQTEIGDARVVVRLVQGVFGQTERRIRLQDTVFYNEAITTASESATRILLVDNTEISLGADSRLVLDKFVYDPDEGTGQMIVNMIAGIFRFASGDMPSDSYDVRTPFANLAIRGTTFHIGEDFVNVGEGAVSLSFPDGQSLDLAEGECFLGFTEAGTPSSASGQACEERLSELGGDSMDDALDTQQARNDMAAACQLISGSDSYLPETGFPSGPPPLPLAVDEDGNPTVVGSQEDEEFYLLHWLAGQWSGGDVECFTTDLASFSGGNGDSSFALSEGPFTPEAPVPVDEPPTWTLIIFGFFGCLLFVWYRGPRHRRQL